LSGALPNGLAWLAAWSFGACSLLVGSEPKPLRCSEDGQVGPPGCDEGQVCVAGICRSARSVGGQAGQQTAGGAGELTSEPDEAALGGGGASG
jgi:hypothetical protein